MVLNRIDTSKHQEHGPFDIIGDIHGCFDETCELLKKLGYHLILEPKLQVSHPQHRKVIFVGDLVDRGPNSADVLDLAMNMVDSGVALCVNGNHDDKLRRYLKGNNVNLSNGLLETTHELALYSAEFKQQVLHFLEDLPYHLILDDGRLAVAHAGIKKKYLGNDTGRVRAFCLYGDTTGQLDMDNLPVRNPWAKEYDGDALVVYGHTPVAKPQWMNHTVNIDTGCVFGGKLTALRYPEMEYVQVKAAKIYSIPRKKFI